jgi:hypothetical protein
MTPPMNAVAPLSLSQIPVLLRGEPQPIHSWIKQWSGARMLLYTGVILLGTGAFGAAVGSWRDPMQGLYSAVKFPLILLLTTAGNGLLNGMLAPLLGTNIGFRQSLGAIFMSFTIAAAVLGAFSPLMYFVVWNSPQFTAVADAATFTTQSFFFVTLVVAMAVAGVAGNVRLLQLLRQLSGSQAAARRTLCAWLIGNLFLGGQLAWNLRPFVGAPQLPVEFLRPTAFEGNFFEGLFNHIRQLFT